MCDNHSQSRRGTKKSISYFAKRLLAEWKRLNLPLCDERVIVAVSGGADSTALLLAVDELQKTNKLTLNVTIAHLEHGLRGSCSRADAEWVAELSTKLGYEVLVERADVKARAQAAKDNLEQAARRARYEFLAAAARSWKARFVLTAHTMDDQTETILLRLLRGSGIEGLIAMEAIRTLASTGDTLLVRPLLSWARRAETERYCRDRQVAFRVDETNRDESLARVRIRQKLIPIMEQLNPRFVEALGRTGDLLREDAAWLEAEAAKLLSQASRRSEVSCEPQEHSIPPLRVEVLAGAPVALRRRALRQWIKTGRGSLRRLELTHIVGVERLLTGQRGGRVAELPGGCRVERRRGWLLFHSAEPNSIGGSGSF